MARSPVVQVKLDALETPGMENARANQLTAQLRSKPGAALDVKTLEDDLLYAYGEGRYSNVAYQLVNHEDKNVLRLFATDKPWGPNFVRSGVNFAWGTRDDARYNVRLAYQMTQLNRSGGELLVTGQFGSDNLVGVNGYQPLHLAARHNNIEFAKLLLSKGVDVNVLTKQAYRVIPGERSNDHVSWWPDNDPAVKVVMMHRSDGAGLPPPPPARPALFIAAQEGWTDMMKLLASAGAKTDFRAGDGSNLVLAAIPSGKADVVRYAIQLNPDINAVTENGTGAIQVALNSSNNIFALQDGYEVEPILRLLAEKGATLDGKNSRGQTPQTIVDRSSPEIQAVCPMKYSCIK